VNQAVLINNLQTVNLTEPDSFGQCDYIEINGDVFTKHIGRLTYWMDPYIISGDELIEGIDNLHRLDGNEITKEDSSGGIQI
jgi:hypothetical protein